MAVYDRLLQIGYLEGMKTSEVDLLLCIEGRAMDADHWAQRWSRNLKTGRLVDVTRPVRRTRGRAAGPIALALAEVQRPVILVGYHLGVVAIAREARHMDPAIVRGAFFVAPADIALTAVANDDDAAVSSDPLPFPSLMIASRSDPRCSFEKASELALAWGSHLVDAGEVGQIDSSSGHGPWPEGLMRLGWFLKRL